MSLDCQIDWLVDRLLEEYPGLEKSTAKKALSAREWLRTRICWGIPKGFVYWWGDQRGTYGAILMRPVNQELLLHGTFKYWDTIFEYDPDGDICWVDFAYGPGLYHKMIALCRTTNCARLGWRHRNRVHLAPMERMPSKALRKAFHF